MILNDNSTQQINTLVIQLQNRITNLNNELKSLNKEIDDLDSKISDLEIRDSSNANDQAKDIAAMNAEIKANTKAISGKADKNHTHIKSEITDFPTSLKNPNALTVNGKTYDGSTAVDAGVQTVANGGTGVTTQADINKAFIGNLDIGASDVTDGTEFVSSYASNNGFSESGYANTPFRRKFSAVWGYIKGKISSVLGLTGTKLTLQGVTVGSNSYTDANPKLEFKNNEDTQNISLTFTDADAVQAPASLTLNGNQGNEYFIAPNIKATGSFYGNLSGKASTAGTADVLANGSGMLKFFYAYSNNSKKLLKLGTFTNGTEASFILTVKRTDGLGFTGYLTINSNSQYSTNIKKFNGYKSSYSIYDVTNGELAFLYRNDDNTNDVYIWCPSYGVVSIILMCGENPWFGGMDTGVTLTEVSGFSGTLLDKF